MDTGAEIFVEVDSLVDAPIGRSRAGLGGPGHLAGVGGTFGEGVGEGKGGGLRRGESGSREEQQGG